VSKPSRPQYELLSKQNAKDTGRRKQGVVEAEENCTMRNFIRYY
jgi:hypothetical protein